MTIFKPCDIRGIAGGELTPKIARKIGNASVQVLKAKQIVLGYDMRLSSKELCNAFTEGVTDAGCDVIDIGLIPTEVCYFAVSHLSTDGGVMITASHNPAKYNGFKICSRNSTPIDYTNGIGEIETVVQNNCYIIAKAKGKVTSCCMLNQYIEHISPHILKTKKMRIIADTGNGMGGVLMRRLADKLPAIDMIPLFWELDGNFPNRGPNPMTPASTEELRKRVVKENADFGIAFDGDADRLMFVDEKGKLINADVILMLIAERYLRSNPGSTVVYDLRCSMAVSELISRLGGVPILSKVGHTNIKKMMREHNAIFAGELSGHYYFKENSFSDSSSVTMLNMLEILSNTNKPLSEMVMEHSPYCASGEISFQIDNKSHVINKLKQIHDDAEISLLDGLTIRYTDWWFNIRQSITEPYIRLNIEAKTTDQLELKKKELIEFLDMHKIEVACDKTNNF